MNEALMQDIGLVCGGFAGGMTFLWLWAIVAAGPRSWNPQPSTDCRQLTASEAEALSKEAERQPDAEIERRA